MTESIKVSVVLTSYNHEKYLREAIDSVLSQTFSNFELIIIDDRSTDTSWEIINTYSDPRIRAFQNQDYKRGTEFFKRIFLDVTKGEYIAIHHSDDVWEPEKLEKQVAFLDSHPEMGAVFTWVKIIDENGVAFDDQSHPYYKIFEQPNRDRHEWLNHFFYYGNALCHPSVLIRRTCYETCGPYRYGFAQLGDLDMWVRLCLKYNIHVLPEKLTRFRVRSDEMNTSGNRPTTLIRTQFESFQILYSYLGVNDPVEFVKIFPSAAEYFKQEQHDIGFALAMSALKSEQNFPRLFGLQELWKILNDASRAKKVQTLYGFSNRDLTELTAQYDVFSAAKLNELYTGLKDQSAMLQSLSSQLAEKERTARNLSSQLVEEERVLAEQERILAEIRNSRSWRTAQLLHRTYNRIAPPESLRDRILRKLFRPSFLSTRRSRQAHALQQDITLIRSSGLFDVAWYLANNPDVAEARVDPVLHYLTNGGSEGRDPGPDFSSRRYLAANEKARKAGINPLLHYLKYGKNEGYLVSVNSPTASGASQPASAQVTRIGQEAPSSSGSGRASLRESAGKILVSTQLWVSRRPALRRLIGRLLPSRVRLGINRAMQANEQAANARMNADLSAALSDWESYQSLSKQMRALNQSTLRNFVPRKPSMVSLDKQNLIVAAKALNIAPPVNPEVSIIIPVHNNAQLTLECLTTIASHTSGTDYEIIVVDDGSDRETLQVLDAIPNVSLIRNDERLGFTQTCNRGADTARGKYVLFLNNDTQVTEGWLQGMVGVFAGQDRVGAVGAKVLYPDGRLQEAGNLINPDGTTTLIGLLDDPDLPRYNFVREVDYCSAVCLMVQADVFRSVGGFEELYSPAYYEDVDLCMKIRASGLKIFYCPDATVIHHLSATSNKIDSSFKLQLVARNRQNFLERWQETIDELNRVKLIAFYLPQYHPIPENDIWWGKGFTEWTNVTRARPNYDGHYQPHLPADLGFYDLRVPEVMEHQVELAKRYNIYGFCYYYYWFSGKRILEMPLERILETGKPDFPFCLCWANENWSRRWDGSEDDLLLAQNHSDQDDRSVILDLIRYLRHPNYIRIDGKPIIVIYRIGLFPDIKRTAQIWREVCREENLGEIHLVMAESFEHSLRSVDPHEYGLDATLEFPPHSMMTPGYIPGALINPGFSGSIYNYRDEVLKYVNKGIPSYTHYHTVIPSWDNTARKQNRSYIFDKATPGAYQAWLETSLQRTREHLAGDQRILFINAWNEWAEGNHLEPDQRFGHRYLEATRNAQERFLLKRGS